MQQWNASARDRIGAVDHQTFVDVLRPNAETLEALANTAREMRERHQFDPSADSIGMRELAEQERYAGDWDSLPIDTANTHLWLLLTAAEDCMQTFAKAIVSDYTPIFAYATLGRAALEHLGLAYWLGEPEIGAKERIRRALNERIYSAWEQERLPGEARSDPGRRQRLLGATACGFTTTKSRKGSLRFLAPDRPSITSHVSRVLGRDALGKLAYSYLSAISHGTMWGLAERIDADLSDASPVQAAPLTIESRDIGIVTVAMVLAHLRAFRAVLDRMAWQSPPYENASQKAQAFVSTFVSSLPEPADVAQDDVTVSRLWVPPSARLQRP